jgi:hypothetical protein
MVELSFNILDVERNWRHILENEKTRGVAWMIHRSKARVFITANSERWRNEIRRRLRE